MWNTPYFSLLRTAWQFARTDRRAYVWVYVRFIAASLLISLEPIIWGVFINEVQLTGSAVLYSAWKYIGVYLLLKVINWSIHGVARVEERELAFRISRNYLETLYEKTVHLPPVWHQDHHSGNTINRIRKAYEALKQFFQRGWEYLHTFSKFVFSFGAMLYFAPLFGLVALALGAVIVVVILRFDRPYIESLLEVNEGEHRLSTSLFDSLSNIFTVIILHLQPRMQRVLTNRITAIYPAFQTNIRINEWKWFTVDMLVGSIYAVILLGYCYQNYVPGEVFLIGGLVTLMGFVQQFTQVFQSVAGQYTQVVNFHTDVRGAAGILQAYDERVGSLPPVTLPPDWTSIRIDDLYFRYVRNGAESGVANGLHGVSLRIRRGERIALIGESGSGKSTLLALLRYLYQPTHVRVRVDEEDYGERLDLLSQLITLFPQEPDIFEGTVRDNITLGLPIDEDRLRALCDTVRLDEVLAHLPAGLDTEIQERGSNLSGGQRQRLALARGLFAATDSSLILMDEPTSSLDPQTERLVYEQLFTALGGRAVISTLHRLHLLPLFDYIYVLDRGRVRAAGSLDELLRSDPAFQRAWTVQS